MTDNWLFNGNIGLINTDDMGLDIVDTPSHTISLWTHYQSISFEQWDITMGGGVNHVTERLVMHDFNADGNNSDSISLDAHMLLSLFATARYNNWQIQVNLDNVLDERYVAAAQGGLARGVHPGAPFMASASLTYSF